MPFDYAIHSDFLIHWTGWDFDKEDWYSKESSNIENPKLIQDYLDRLIDILKYGFWLTDEPETKITINGKEITIPSTQRVCFTELKLSESRKHAKEYGRLGIGIKRPYLFCRHGRPLVYYGFGGNNQRDPFLCECANNFKDMKLLNFFKPMNSQNHKPNYDFYNESEWRIPFLQELLNKRAQKGSRRNL